MLPKLRPTCLLLAVCATFGSVRADEPREPLSVYAAGSLRSVLTELGKAFERQAQVRVKLTAGPRGC